MSIEGRLGDFDQPAKTIQEAIASLKRENHSKCVGSDYYYLPLVVTKTKTCFWVNYHTVNSAGLGLWLEGFDPELIDGLGI